ncbi:MAG: hypothetical protein ACOYKZ_07390 [Chlamydiia bacterium]
MSKMLNRVLSLLVAAGAPLAAAEHAALSGGPDSSQAYILQEWMADNFGVKLKNKGGQLQLAGLVTFEGAGVSETINGEQMYGPCGRCEKPSFPFRGGFSLSGNYKAKHSWAVWYLNYSNVLGIEPGESDGLSLDRAYLGYAFIDDGERRLELNVGRRFIGDIMSSSVQFASQLDGFDMRYADVLPKAGDGYVEALLFIVNLETNHWAWAAEAGLLDIGESGFYCQLSWIDWRNIFGATSFIDSEDEVVISFGDPRFQYANLQPQIGYNWEWSFWGLDQPFNLYAGASYNFAARSLTITNCGDKPEPGDFCGCPAKCIEVGREPWAAFVGLTVGDLGEPGNWLADIHYELVQAQAVPQFDVEGVGRGNCAHYDFYESGLGDTNYQGVAMRVLYQITAHITVQASYSYSQSLNNDIGCPTCFQKGKCAVTYAF